MKIIFIWSRIQNNEIDQIVIWKKNSRKYINPTLTIQELIAINDINLPQNKCISNLSVIKVDFVFRDYAAPNNLGLFEMIRIHRML